MWLLSIDLEVIGVSLLAKRKVFKDAVGAKTLWMEMPGIRIQEQEGDHCS